MLNTNSYSILIIVIIQRFINKYVKNIRVLIAIGLAEKRSFTIDYSNSYDHNDRKSVISSYY